MMQLQQGNGNWNMSYKCPLCGIKLQGDNKYRVVTDMNKLSSGNNVSKSKSLTHNVVRFEEKDLSKKESCVVTISV